MFVHTFCIFSVADKRGIPDGGNNSGEENRNVSRYIGTARGTSLTSTSNQNNTTISAIRSSPLATSPAMRTSPSSAMTSSPGQLTSSPAVVTSSKRSSSTLRSSPHSPPGLIETRFEAHNDLATTAILPVRKEGAEYASCESIVSGKGRVSVLKKSSQSSLNSILSSNSCLKTNVADTRGYVARKERHGVSFAVPQRDTAVQSWDTEGLAWDSVEPNRDTGVQSWDTGPQAIQAWDTSGSHRDTGAQSWEPMGSVQHHGAVKTSPEEAAAPNMCTIGTSTYLEDTSYDHFTNLDEFGIMVGASSDSSLISGTYSYDPVFSTDDEGKSKRLSPSLVGRRSEVDPWRVDNIPPFGGGDCGLVRKDTPPPKSVLPKNNEKDLRDFIRRRHTRNLSMSTQTLRRSHGISSENLVSQCDSNEASQNSLEQNLPLLYSEDKEVRYENIATISAAIRDRTKTNDDMVLNIIKKIKSPDESTYL